MRVAANGWTGGQYSLVRAALGAYLVAHFAALLPYGAELFSRAGVLPRAELSPLAALFPNVLARFDAPAVVGALLALGVAAGVLVALGWRDRLAAVVAWYVLACLAGRNPLIANPSLPYVGWMLLAHAALPPAPYGSLAARGRADPDGGWRFPPALFALAWVALALGYTYSGLTKLASPSWLDGTAVARVLENPLARPTGLRTALLALPGGVLALLTWGALAAELLFAPLALLRRARPWIWSALLAMHVGLIAVIDFADLSLGMVLFHLFTLDPAWIRPRTRDAAVHVHYDGACGLCQAWVRFLLAEDRAQPYTGCRVLSVLRASSKERLRFSPLAGETSRRALGPAADSSETVVVRTASGARLERSDALLCLLATLGGLWRVLAALAAPVPRPLRDAAYRAVARARRRLLAPPPAACPTAPAEVARRFDP